ncbi:MAG: glycosyltransferase [Candidatus Absconditabacterales bacterium]
MYDKKGTTIADKLKEWGGNPVWIPLGARADHINTNIDFDNRDIEVCYIGNINPRKLFRLSKLKRHFGARLKLYGGQGNGDWKSLKGIFYKIVNKLFGLGYIEPISEDKLKEIYGRTKIGFNMHLVSWKGPSNSRMYELPINGVMQLCDNKLGLNRVFEVGKEVVAYENIHNAIQKIEYYLQNDEERIKVAKAGYERAIKYYTYDLVWKRILSVMSQD